MVRKGFLGVEKTDYIGRQSPGVSPSHSLPRGLRSMGHADYSPQCSRFYDCSFVLWNRHYVTGMMSHALPRGLICRFVRIIDLFMQST